MLIHIKIIIQCRNRKVKRTKIILLLDNKFRNSISTRCQYNPTIIKVFSIKFLISNTKHPSQYLARIKHIKIKLGIDNYSIAYSYNCSKFN